MDRCRIVIPGKDEDVYRYVSIVKRLGAEAFTTLEVPDPEDYDGLIIPGGADIDPCWYGQENTGCRTINPEKDKLDFGCMEVFDKAGKPVLGICNGLQIINVYYGGDLIQHIDTYRDHQHTFSGDSWHDVTAEPGTFMERLYGTHFRVNSAHHQAAGRLGKDLKIALLADDGVTEALYHEKAPVWGVQWHPERMFPPEDERAVSGADVYEFFIEQCERLMKENRN